MEGSTLSDKTEIRLYLERCRDAVRTLPRYAVADDALKPVFDSRHRNTDAADVLLKVALLNSLYATSIYDVFRMAQHVHRLGKDLDRWLADGAPQAVNRIRRGHGIRTKAKRDRDFYSFATKYCHWHRPVSVR